MPLQKRIRRIGGGLGVLLPLPMAKAFDYEAGMLVEIVMDKQTITLRKVSPEVLRHAPSVPYDLFGERAGR